MLQAVLVWMGAVLAIGLLLAMALGPVIVEVDSWWLERRHTKKVRKAVARKSEAPGAQCVHPLPAGVVLAEEARRAQRAEVVAERRGGDRQAEGAAGPVALSEE